MSVWSLHHLADCLRSCRVVRLLLINLEILLILLIVLGRGLKSDCLEMIVIVVHLAGSTAQEAIGR